MMKITVDAGNTTKVYNSWTPVIFRISQTAHKTVSIHVDNDEIQIELYTARPTVIEKRVKDPRKKGTQMMLDICKHCHEMTYLILGFKPLMKCLHCNKDIW